MTESYKGEMHLKKKRAKGCRGPTAAGGAGVETKRKEGRNEGKEGREEGDIVL